MPDGGFVRAGEIPLLAKIAKETAPLTRAELKLEAAAAEIHQNPDAVERAYMARQLVQCTMPHSNPGDVAVWTRTNGKLTLGIQPGVDLKTGKSYGYPYGTLPRLLLFWITTEAVQTKSRRIELGRSLASFMRELGLDPDSRGKRSDAKRLRDQMTRLFSARISFQQTLEESGYHGQRWLNMDVAPEGELWWDPKRPEQGALWESWILLGEKFFSAITAAPVPTDMRALRALKRSPLALDLYAWAAHRVYRINRAGEPQFIPWRRLANQMGANYASVDESTRKIKIALLKVVRVWRQQPGLRVRMPRGSGGFVLYPSALPIVEC